MPHRNYCLYDEEKANSALPLFLQDHLPVGSSKIKELADYLHCSVQAVNQYKQGTAFPKTENLIKIALFFGCSLDYLIGLSDVKTPDASIQAICEYTGLSEDAVRQLHLNNELKENNDSCKSCLDGINILLEDTQCGNSILANISEYIRERYNAFFTTTADGTHELRSNHIELCDSQSPIIDIHIRQMKSIFMLWIQEGLTKLHEKIKEGREDNGKR